MPVTSMRWASRLVGVEDEESNHQREQAGGFCEGETQNGVAEELTYLIHESVDNSVNIYVCD